MVHENGFAYWFNELLDKLWLILTNKQRMLRKIDWPNGADTRKSNDKDFLRTAFKTMTRTEILLRKVPNFLNAFWSDFLYYQGPRLCVICRKNVAKIEPQGPYWRCHFYKLLVRAWSPNLSQFSMRGSKNLFRRFKNSPKYENLVAGNWVLWLARSHEKDGLLAEIVIYYRSEFA